MVAIFTGSGFGFERGSASVLGGSGLLGSALQGWGGDGVYVNAASGNLLVQKQDEFLVGKGPDIGVSRTYNSLTTLADDNNDKWRQSTDRRVYGLTGTLNTAGSTVKRVSGDGTEITYTWDASVSAYVTKDGGGAYDRIVSNGTEWVWTDGDSQSVERYESTGTGRIKSVADRNGTTVTFAYDGSGRLGSVTTSDGSWIQYGYTGASLNVTQIVTGYTDLATSTSKTLTRTRYGYDGSNRLTTVTVDLTPGDNSIADGATYVTTYSYDAGGRLSNIAQSDGSNLAITYDGSNRIATLVQTETTGVTRTTSFTYGTLYTTITDPAGQVTRLDYDAAGNLTKITAPPAYSGAAQQIVQFAYNADGDLTSTTDALGNTTTFSSFTANGLAQTVTDRLGSSITRTYSAANLLLSETHTGVDATGSAVSQTTRYVYNAAGNLRFAISAEGRVTEYTRDSAGQVTYETVYTEAAYTTAGTPSEAAMTTWVGGLSNKSWVQKTKYLYDARGAVTSVTGYGIANNAGTEQTTEGTSVTSFVYDQAGQLLSSYSGSNTATSYLYDGMGRVVSTSDANGGTTTIVYTAASLTTTITLASGYVTTKTYNKAGDLVSVTDSGANTAGGTTGYAYDKLGRVRVRTDAYNATKTYYIYDNAGRQVGMVDHLGYLTEYRYDANNRLIGTIAYKNAVSSANRAALAGSSTWGVAMSALRPNTPTANDISSWTVYDKEGRVLQTIAGDGSTTISTYDAAGRLQKATAYANKLSAGTMNAIFASGPGSVTTPTTSSNDAVARMFYDKDGLLLGTLSGEGYLTKNVYDSAGQLVATTAYATVTSAGLRATGSFNALLTSVGTSAQDRTSRFVYDGQGLLRYTIDALNQAMRYDYDSAGQQVRTAVYAAPLGSTGDYTYDNVKSLATGLEASSAKRVSYAVYDAAGRLAYGIDPLGAVTGYSYDNRGQVTKVVQYASVNAVASLPALAAMSSWAAGQAGNSGNRVTRTWYTARGEAAYVVNAAGHVSRNLYNADGRLLSTTVWSNTVSVSDSTTFAQVAAAVSGTAVTSYLDYDSLGRIVRETDGAGTQTALDYFGTTGLVIKRTRADTGTAAEKAIDTTAYDGAGRAVSTTLASGTGEAATASRTYDGKGEVLTATDARSHVTTYTYDLDGRVMTVTDAASGVTSFEYNAFGEVWKATDPKGNVSYTWYDKLGRTTTSRDAANYLTQTGYTVFGEIASVKRWMTAVTGTPTMGAEPAGSGTSATTTFTYNARGQVLSSTDALNNAKTYTYDSAFGDRLTETNRLGAVTSFAYDKLGRLVRQGTSAATTNYTTATGSSTAGTYIVSTYAYDARGNRTQMAEGYASAALTGTVTALRTTGYTYDGANRVTRVDHDAVTTIADNMVTVTNNVAVFETYSYDQRGNVIKAVDAGEAQTYSYYDRLDRKTAEIRQLAANQWVYTAYIYDANGNLTGTKVYAGNPYPSGSPPLGGTPPSPPSGAWRETAFAYDNLDRMVASSVVGTADAIVSGSWNGSAYTTNAGAGAAAQALTTTYQYDADGNVVSLTDPNGKVTWSWYDSLNRKVAQLDGEQYLTKWVYDAEGNVTRETRYATKFTGTPALGTMPNVSTHAADRITDFEYDLAGNRTKETRLNVAAWSVNATSGTLSAAGTNAIIEYTYNALGQVTAKKISGVTVAGYTYENTGRLQSETRQAFTDANGSSVTPTTSYAYDALGNLVNTTQLGTSSGTFTAANRTTIYRYGQGGRLLSTQDAEGNFHTYFYDKAGRLKKDQYDRIVNADNTVASSGTTTVTEARGTTYDLAGRALTQSVYSTVGGTLTRIDFASFMYNAFDQVTFQGTGSTAGGAAMYQIENRYDAAGRMVATNADGGVWKLFSYDKAGNQTGTIASAGAALSSSDTFAGKLGSVGAANLNGTWTLYDGRGQAVRVIEEGRDLSATVTNQTLNTYRTYNAFGEIASETNALGKTITYTYNTMGRKIRSESPGVEITNENGSTNWVKPSEDYYYDLGGRLIATRDANGTYASGGSSGAPQSKAANTGNLTTYAILGSTGLDTGSGGSQSLIAAEFHADGGKKQMLYDRLGDLRIVRDELYSSGAPNLHQEERRYNKLGQLIEVKHNRATNVSDDSTRLIDGYKYDQFGQRIQHWNNVSGATPIYGEPVWVSEGHYEPEQVWVESGYYDGYYGWVDTSHWAPTGNTIWVDTSHWEYPIVGYQGSPEKIGYDALGRVTAQTDLTGQGTFTTYAWDGSLTTSIGGGAITLGGWTETTSYSGTTRSSTVKTDIYNRELWKSDLGAHVTTAAYDLAGRLTSNGGMTYTWYSTGLVKTAASITGDINSTNWDRKIATYGYDAVGQRTSESLVNDGSVESLVWIDYPYYWEYQASTYFNQLTNQTATYDALGRITQFAEAGTGAIAAATTDHKYDAAGNIRRTVSTHKTLDQNGNASSGSVTDDYWFRYDGMNRLVTDRGTLSGANIMRGLTGQELVYDAAGQRVAAIRTESAPGTFWYDGYDFQYIPGYQQESREIYIYDGAGHITQIRVSLGAAAYESVSYYNYTYYITPPSYIPPAPSGPGAGTQRSVFAYDLMGRQTGQTDYDTNGTSVVHSRTASYDGAGKLLSDYTSTVRFEQNGSTATYTTSTTYTYTASGQYLLGAVASMSATNAKNGSNYTTSSTINTYLWWNGPVQGTIVYKPNTSQSTTHTTTLTYDALGALKSASIQDGRPRTVTFRTNLEGQVIKRDETDNNYSQGDPHEQWLRFAGREWGYAGNNGTSRLGAAASIQDRRAYVGTGAFRNGAAYGAQYSDFAQSLDPINAYSQGSAAGSYTVQRTGDTLAAIAQALWGDSSLWYKLAEANGLAADTGLVEGQRLTVPVGVIRSAHNASTLRPYNPAEAIGDVQPTTPLPPPKKKGSCLGAIFLAVIAIAVTFILKVPLTNLFGSKVAGFAAAAMVGSAVSQGIGVATGLQEKFSFGAVALAGVSALAGGLLDKIPGLDKIAGSTFLGDVAKGALGSAVTQGIGVATGLQDKFSWAGVAAAGLGSAAGGAVGRSLGLTPLEGAGLSLSNIAGHALAGTANALANAATRSAIEGSNFGDNVMRALPDVIASTIGQALGGALTSRNAGAAIAQRTVTNGTASAADGSQTTTTGEGAEIIVTARRSSYTPAYIDYFPQVTAAPQAIVEVRPESPAAPDAYQLFRDSGWSKNWDEWGSRFDGALRLYHSRGGAKDGYNWDNVWDSLNQDALNLRTTEFLISTLSMDIPDLTGSVSYQDRISRGYSISSYTPSTWRDLTATFSNATEGGYRLRDSAYENLASGRYVIGTLKYAGSVGLRTLETLNLGIELTVSLARRHGVTPTAIDRQDAAVLAFASGGMGAMRTGAARLAAESMRVRGLGASPYATNGDLVQSIATRADNWGIRNGMGNGPLVGTTKHGYAETLLNRYQRMFGDRGLITEARYVGGRPWESGITTTGSIRLDVVEGPLRRPTHVWDYKFGQATLLPSRIAQIQTGIPNGANVPILMVKP